MLRNRGSIMLIEPGLRGLLAFAPSSLSVAGFSTAGVSFLSIPNHLSRIGPRAPKTSVVPRSVADGRRSAECCLEAVLDRRWPAAAAPGFAASGNLSLG